MNKKVYVSRQKPIYEQGVHNLCLNDERMSKLWSNGVSFEKIVDDYLNSVYFNHMHTYNPLVLNYFTNDDAIDLFYIYNHTHSVEARLFRIPAMMEKLSVMGPGEVVADTNVDELLNIDYFDFE